MFACTSESLWFCIYLFPLAFILFIVLFYLAKTSAGNNGQVERSYIQFFLTLRRKDIRKYPLSLLKLMARYAEDLIWANRISNGKAVFRFLLRLTQRRSDSSELRKG